MICRMVGRRLKGWLDEISKDCLVNDLSIVPVLLKDS
jgi:hypothetical protein